ncbi:MAG: 4Fe-4S dicluster domain-containing protein [Terracidiphilus sp.]
MARYGIAVDVEKCTGCYSCFLACKDEYVGNDYLPLTAAQPAAGHQWLRIKEVEHGAGSKVKVDYIPILCQQCEQAPCMLADGQGEVYRRKDGIVVIDPEKAKGHREIVDACPYGVIFWNEEKALPQKCTFCAHRLDAGEKDVRCAESCPTGALVFGDLDDAGSKVSQVLKAKKEKVESFKPEFGARPVVQYISLPKPFIAGEVLLSDKPGECLRGAKVTLEAKAEKKILVTETDFLGDFEFKGLAADTDYILRAEHEGYLAKELTVRTNASLNVGEVVLIAK